MSNCKWTVKENTHLRMVDCGWGNGYVFVPRSHPCYGMAYEDACEKVEAHGGLTFSSNADEIDWPEKPDGVDGWWVFGYDTAHLNDDIKRWPESAVRKETERLCGQFDSLSESEAA